MATVDGPRKALVLKMAAASLRDYRLGTRDGPEEYGPSASSLAPRGDVTLDLTRFSGCIEGVLCVTFSPEGLPAPPVIPPFVFMTRVSRRAGTGHRGRDRHGRAATGGVVSPAGAA
ncbi:MULTISPECIES: hypothetical protein [unclassified Streptomyces]|uniref:hypothetical protein n=1 Tax=unclassified Streptomyces TaxID=2593676 RepID=UPI0014450995|nr:hypothetical protein [Streptomyces sp. A1136]